MEQSKIEQMEAKITEKAAESMLSILEKHGLDYTKMPRTMQKIVIEIYQQGAIDTLEEIKK